MSETIAKALSISRGDSNDDNYNDDSSDGEEVCDSSLASNGDEKAKGDQQQQQPDTAPVVVVSVDPPKYRWEQTTITDASGKYSWTRDTLVCNDEEFRDAIKHCFYKHNKHQPANYSTIRLAYFAPFYRDFSHITDLDKLKATGKWVDMKAEHRDPVASLFLNEIVPRFKRSAEEAKTVFTASAGMHCADMLPFIFKKEDFVAIRLREGTWQGAFLRDTPYIYVPFYGETVSCNFTHLGFMKDKCFNTTTSRSTQNFGSLQNTGDFAVFLTDEMAKTLHDRGLKFKALVSGPSFRVCSGDLWVKTWWDLLHYHCADSRVMIDPVGYTQNQEDSQRHYDSDNSVEVSKLDSSRNWLLPAIVHGFSLRLKMWGHFVVDELEEVVWQEKPLESLVLPPTLVKNLSIQVRASLTLTKSAIKVGLKGSGLAILLYGPPGSGKTALGEAITEHYHTPLYYVTGGELGDNAGEMEKRLEKIAELVRRWKGIILIDEADLFVRTRTEDNDVTRNNMVCVFLKFLEYTDAIVFLTSNIRADSVDQALKSRLNFNIAFEKISVAKVWPLSLAKRGLQDTLTQEDINILIAKHPNIDGRVIDNVCKNVDRKRKVLASMKKEEEDAGVVSDAITVNDYLEALSFCVGASNIA